MKEYTKTNEWIETKDNIATIGITKDGIEEIGDVVAIDLPEIGKEVKEGEVLFSVESAKAVNNIYSPVSGKIVEVNEKLNENAELLNESPEEEGWVVKIKI